MSSFGTTSSSITGIDVAPTPPTPPTPPPTHAGMFPLIRQISANASICTCPVCFESVGGRGDGHLEDLRLGCRCAIHYECLILYFRNCLKDRQDIRDEGIPCPYKKACEALKSQKKGTDAVIAATSLASRRDSAEVTSSTLGAIANSSNAVYYITTEDMDAVVDYGFTEQSTPNAGGGGGGPAAVATTKELNPVLLQRLQDLNCDPLSHQEVANLRQWIQERRQGVAITDSVAMDPYVLGTTKACPTCTFRSSHYHGHQCHHISPITRGCPNCHVSYCYKCLSTEVENLKERQSSNKCKCGYWSNFCSTLKNENDVKQNVFIDNGIPRDRRCGCSFCSECAFNKPCPSCSGDCSVCRGVVNPGPLSIYEKWEIPTAAATAARSSNGSALPAVNGAPANLDPISRTRFNLWEACRHGNLADITANLTYREGATIVHSFINSQDAEGKTPLILCCENDHFDCVRALLDIANVNVNLADFCGRTPLYYASNNGFSRCTSLLLNAPNVNVNSATHGGFLRGATPLWAASRAGHLDCINLLLAKADIDVNIQVEGNRSPLFLATFFGHTECARSLCAHKNINVNQVNRKGQPAILWACNFGFSEIVRILVSHKNIDVEIADQEGYTAYYWANRYNYVECANLVKSKMKVVDAEDTKVSDKNYLFGACKRGDLEGLKTYCRLNGPAVAATKINEYDKDGLTPFLLAVRENKLQVVEAFLSGEIFSSSSSSSLSGSMSKRAIILEQIAGLEGLLNDLNPKNDGGAADIESTNVKLWILKDQLKHCSEDNVKEDATANSSDMKAGGGAAVASLLSSSLISNKSLVEFNKADKNYGYRALHYAVCLNLIDMVRLLLSNKLININLRANSGDTAIMIACSYSKTYEAVRILLKEPEIDLLIMNEEGDDVINVIDKNNSTKIIPLLGPLYLSQREKNERKPKSVKLLCQLSHPEGLIENNSNHSEFFCEMIRNAVGCISSKSAVRPVDIRRIYKCQTNNCICCYCGVCYDAKILDLGRTAVRIEENLFYRLGLTNMMVGGVYTSSSGGATNYIASSTTIASSSSSSSSSKILPVQPIVHESNEEQEWSYAADRTQAQGGFSSPPQPSHTEKKKEKSCRCAIM